MGQSLMEKPCCPGQLSVEINRVTRSTIRPSHIGQQWLDFRRIKEAITSRAFQHTPYEISIRHKVKRESRLKNCARSRQR